MMPNRTYDERPAPEETSAGENNEVQINPEQTEYTNFRVSNPPSWQRSKQWSDGFLDEIKRILGVHLIGEPPIEEDQERNTDLMVLRMDRVRIACRVRQNRYLRAFADEFTIRSSRPSGNKTELSKIIEGWGEYALYGFGSKGGTTLAAWHLIDLNVFRLGYTRMMARLPQGVTPGSQMSNTDGSSAFVSFKYEDFLPALVVARGGPHFNAVRGCA